MDLNLLQIAVEEIKSELVNAHRQRHFYLY